MLCHPSFRGVSRVGRRVFEIPSLERSLSPLPSPEALGRSILVVTALLALVCGPSWAQADRGSISGQISPTHDHDMAQATASLPGLALEVAVDADGSFEFDAVRVGTHVLRVHVPTLGVAVQNVEVTAGQMTSVEIEITPGGHFDEVVVTATGEARAALELSSAVTTLSGAELLERSEASLGETLSNEAGVSSSFFGQGVSRPIIRGLSGDRIRVLEDGIGTGDASDVSVDHAVTTDPLQAERIEILRGPATLLYGSSAIGGAVNVIDERVPTTRAGRTISGTVDLRGGSVSDERLGSVNLGGGGGEWAWNANVMARETDDYEIPGFAGLDEHDEHDEHDDDDHEEEEHEEEHDEHGEEGEHEEENPFGIVPNSDLKTEGGRFGVTRFFGDRGFLGVSVSGFNTEYGIPGGLEHAEHGEDEHDDEHDDDEHDDDEHDDDEHGDDEHDEHGDEHGEGSGSHRHEAASDRPPWSHQQ